MILNLYVDVWSRIPLFIAYENFYFYWILNIFPFDKVGWRGTRQITYEKGGGSMPMLNFAY